MSGVTATILLRAAFTPADTGRVTQLLRAVSPEVSESRKGRHWDFAVTDGTASLSVLSTIDHAADFEDDLLANDLLFEDAPDAFVLSFPTGRECDQDLCHLLADKLGIREAWMSQLRTQHATLCGPAVYQQTRAVRMQGKRSTAGRPVRQAVTGRIGSVQDAGLHECTDDHWPEVHRTRVQIRIGQ